MYSNSSLSYTQLANGYSNAKSVKMSSLQEKTDLTTVNEDNKQLKFDGDDLLVYQKAIQIKNEGNDEFKSKNYKKAIEAYGEAITLLLSLDIAKCERELAICYQNRAAAYEHLHKIAFMIEDATNAIKTDKTYAKGYFRRARGYIIEKKIYRALEDIVWACILEHFRNDIYNKMAADINAKNVKTPINEHVKLFLTDPECHELVYKWRSRRAIDKLRDSTVLDNILRPIGINSTAKGFFRAVKAFMESDMFEIIAGCTEEIAGSGQYWIECKIILGYVTNLFGETVDENFVRGLKVLIEHRNTPQGLRNDLILSLANVFMSKFVGFTVSGRLGEAKTAYQLVQRTLSGIKNLNQSIKSKMYVIKSGIIQSATVLNAHNASPTIAAQITSDLLECSQLMPNFYHAHYQIQNFNVKQGNFHSIGALKSLKEVCDRFPDHFQLRSLYITQLGLKFNNKTEAIRELKEYRLSNPERVGETWGIEGLLHDGQSESVSFFEEAIKYTPHDGLYYIKLAKYFIMVTNEYERALKVLNMGLKNNVFYGKYGELFELRQNLLTIIVG